MQTGITILMDDRERSPLLFQTLTAMHEVDLHVQRLARGDYQVDDHLLFERKTLPDFALSVIDGRLFRQMTQLAASPLKSILILEGSGRDFGSTGVRREALQGALVFVSLILGIPVLRSIEPGETGRLIVYAARQARLASTDGAGRSGRRPRGKRKRQLYLLQGLPGVGPMRAARLLEHFGTVRDVFNANMDALIAVDGIGTDVAKRINDAVGETILSYGDDADWMFEI
ncbi:MAG: ERCC4 domain-containing protein [Desulfosarcina sp.]